MSSRNFSTSHKKIFEYWKHKAITKDGTIITDDFKTDTIPVVYDWGEPRCFACGRYGCDCDKYIDKMESGDIWNEKEVKSNLQRCHIIAQSLGGGDTPDNLFLLCEKCHRESPDTIYPKMFFKFIYKKRTQDHWLQAALKELRNDYDITIPKIEGLAEFEEKLNEIATTHCGLSDETLKAAYVGYALQKEEEFYTKIWSRNV